MIWCHADISVTIYNQSLSEQKDVSEVLHRHTEEEEIDL